VIKFILNHIPRPLLQKMAGLAMPLAGLFYAIGRGRQGGDKGVECPLCGARYRRFMPYGYVSVRRNALCPRCLALERHRLLWLWIERETDLLSGKRKAESGKSADAESISRNPLSRNQLSTFHFQLPTFLHIAPEVCLSRRFEKIFPPDNYITADLESPLAKVHLDVQNIPFPDESFDIVFCNHVLEHVADDRLAMRELHRVMKPGGWGVMLSPVDETRAETFEDDTITDPAERTRIFGQYDHRRIYGRDYADRLRETGWKVEEIDYLATLTPAEREKYALRPETLYIVQKI
jgi:hypothetical protein